MTANQTNKQPISETLLHSGQELNDAAYKSFTDGGIDQYQLTSFYQLVSTWSKFTGKILDEMERLGIRE
jgi:hypothetical protein